MNQGTKFAIGIMLMLISMVLLFFAFNNLSPIKIGSQSITVNSPNTFLQALQAFIGQGPGTTSSTSGSGS